MFKPLILSDSDFRNMRKAITQVAGGYKKLGLELSAGNTVIIYSLGEENPVIRIDIKREKE